MKKILLTLAGSFLLSACLAPVQEENKNQNTNTTPSENQPVNQEENNQNSGNGSENTNTNEGGNEQGNENQNGNETPGEDNNNDSEQGGQTTTNTQTIDKTVTFTDGTFVGQLDQENKRNQFVTYFNGSDDLLSSVSLVGKSESKEFSCETLVNGQKVTENHVYWWMGSGSYTGKLTMNFNYDVVGIQLSIQAYNKTYVDTWSADEPFVSYILDNNAKLYIDSQDYVKDLSCTGTDKPDIVDFSKEYTTPTKQISIGNFEEGQRVFIHSIKIAYIA